MFKKLWGDDRPLDSVFYHWNPKTWMKEGIGKSHFKQYFLNKVGHLHNCVGSIARLIWPNKMILKATNIETYKLRHFSKVNRRFSLSSVFKISRGISLFKNVYLPSLLPFIFCAIYRMFFYLRVLAYLLTF